MYLNYLQRLYRSFRVLKLYKTINIYNIHKLFYHCAGQQMDTRHIVTLAYHVNTRLGKKLSVFSISDIVSEYMYFNRNIVVILYFYNTTISNWEYVLVLNMLLLYFASINLCHIRYRIYDIYLLCAYIA